MECVLNLSNSSKLPLIDNVLTKILNTGKTRSDLQKECVNNVVKEIYEFWAKIFGTSVLVTKGAVRKRITKLLENYDLNVYKKGAARTEETEFMKCYNKLLDLMKDERISEMSDMLQTFYQDQKSSRIFVASDFEHCFYKEKINDRPSEEPLLSQSADNEEIELSNDKKFSNLLQEQKPSRSGLVRINTVKYNASTQVDDVPFTPKIRQNRMLTTKIKTTIALACVDAGITPNQSRKAFQSISKNFYGAIYYLDIEEIPEEISEEIPEEIPEEIAKKPQKRSIGEENSRPVKKLKSDLYEFVLPSYKTICETKHRLSINQEKNLALQLLEKPEDIKVSAHYDTTSRKFLKYEWTSLIFEFSNGQKFSAKPLPLGVENRETIVSYFVEQILRLATAANVSAKRIWESIDTFMTDSVSKNLEIAQLIAAKLNSEHIPLQLLCNTHTCEGFDRGNLKVLKIAENAVSLREHLISSLTEIKSFVKNKTCTEAALTALIKLCCNDGHKSSQYDIFDAILAEKSRTRKFTIFKERRFCQLGYSAAAVLYHLDDIKDLLKRTKSTNLLVRACKLYVENSYLVNSFKALAIFTNEVTMPFLYFNEKSTQEDCVKMFPELYRDLCDKRLDTLRNFKVDYSFEIPSIDSNIVRCLIDNFCVQASSDLKTQKGREYGFGNDKKLRATDLSSLSQSELKGLPCNNLVCERELGKVDYLLSTSSKTSPKHFEGLGKFHDLFQFKIFILFYLKAFKTASLCQEQQKKLLHMTKRKLEF